MVLPASTLPVISTFWISDVTRSGEISVVHTSGDDVLRRRELVTIVVGRKVSEQTAKRHKFKFKYTIGGASGTYWTVELVRTITTKCLTATKRGGIHALTDAHTRRKSDVTFYRNISIHNT